MSTSEIKIGGVVRLQSGGPILTLVNQTPHLNTFAYFDNTGVYHTLELPNSYKNDEAFKSIYE